MREFNPDIKLEKTGLYIINPTDNSKDNVNIISGISSTEFRELLHSELDLIGGDCIEVEMESEPTPDDLDHLLKFRDHNKFGPFLIQFFVVKVKLEDDELFYVYRFDRYKSQFRKSDSGFKSGIHFVSKYLNFDKYSEFINGVYEGVEELKVMTFKDPGESIVQIYKDNSEGHIIIVEMREDPVSYFEHMKSIIDETEVEVIGVMIAQFDYDNVKEDAIHKKFQKDMYVLLRKVKDYNYSGDKRVEILRSYPPANYEILMQFKL